MATYQDYIMSYGTAMRKHAVSRREAAYLHIAVR
jgi:hypothetical protein